MKYWILVILILTSFNSLANEKSDCAQKNAQTLNLELRPKLESIGIAVGEAQWTHDDMFEGNIVIFSAKVHAAAGETEGVDKDGFKTQYYVGSFENESQFGEDGLEYNYLRVAAITKQKVKELESNGKLQLIEKGVKLGNFQVSRDLPLAQSAYLEVEPVRAFATVGWSPKALPDLELIAKASVSLGYARAQSVKDHVQDTSNFYYGHEWGVGAKLGNAGTIMLERGVDGPNQKYDIDSTSSREAVVRFAYSKSFGEEDRWSINAVAEKRSFRLGPDYEKGKRYWLQIQRKF